MPPHGADRCPCGHRCRTDRRRVQARRRPPQAPAGQGQARLAREPRGLRQRPRTPDPGNRARVRRLRHRGSELPARRAVRGAVHRLPAQAGRLRPAPARRADDPREAADGRGHARPARRVRLGDREVRAAPQGPRHHAPEHPGPPRAAARRGEADPRALGRRPLIARGLWQHRPQRHRRSLRRHQRGRAVRHHAVRGGLRALLRPPPRTPSSCRARSRPRSPPPTRTSRSPASTTSASSRASATACAGSRSGSAAAPRSCRGSRRPCTSSSSSRTATT